MELGSILRTMRLKRGFSQEKMAEKLYIARSSISKIENNLLKIAGEDLIKWCRITNQQEVLMAVMCGVDMTIVHQLIEVASSGVIGAIIGGLSWISIF